MEHQVNPAFCQIGRTGSIDGVTGAGGIGEATIARSGPQGGSSVNQDTIGIKRIAGTD